MEKQTIKRIDLSQVKPGDKLIRLIGNEVPMPVIVGEIDDEFIYVGSVEKLPYAEDVPATKEEGWKFRKDRGTEVDEDLGADGINMTVSILRPWDESLLRPVNDKFQELMDLIAKRELDKK